MNDKAKPTGVVNIRGKEYSTVALRITKFRAEHPLWATDTEILQRDADLVLVKATIADETGRVLSTGHAEEWRKSSEINKTSAVENAETSALGRALAALGYGGSEFASADEIRIALDKREAAEQEPAELTADEQTALQNLRDASLNGTAALKTQWEGLTPEMRRTLQHELASLKAAAAKADKKAA